MNTPRLCVFALMVLLLGPAFGPPGLSPAWAHETATSERVLTGELVITNAFRNQFRVVGHAGTFTAPPGMIVETFDGKPVRVELSRDGRVVQITEKQIYIEPIEHGFEVVSGQLVVTNAATGTFAIAGDNRTYVAPPRIDVRPYAGRMVLVRLDEQGRVTSIDMTTRAGDAPASRSSRACRFGSTTIADSSSICRDGVTFRCADGEWVNLHTPCS